MNWALDLRLVADAAILLMELRIESVIRAPCSLREPHAPCESIVHPARACAVRSDRIREF